MHETIRSCSIDNLLECYSREDDDMSTMTRLWTVLILCILVLTLNVLAVVKDLYVLPVGKAAETTLPVINPWHRLDRYNTSAGYPVAHAASTPPDPRY